MPIMGSGNVSEIYICGLIVCLTPLAHAACRTAWRSPRHRREHTPPRGISEGQSEEKCTPVQGVSKNESGNGEQGEPEAVV